MKTLAAVVLLLSLTKALDARAAEPGTLTLRGSVGFGTQSLQDVNRDIALDAATTRPLATSLRWEEFGAAIPIGFEADVQLSRTWSCGLGVSWQKSSVAHDASLDFVDPETGIPCVGAQVERQRLKLFDVYGTAAFWIPRAPGLHVGGQLGIAWGSLELSGGRSLDGADGSFAVTSGGGEADAMALSAGIYLGYERAATRTLAVSTRIGYLSSDLGMMEGTYRFAGVFDAGSFNGWAHGPFRDSNGKAMDFDFSGLRASGAVTMRLGGIGRR